MSKWALILGGLFVGALAIFSLSDLRDTSPAPTEAGPKGIKRHAFLEGLELGQDGNGYALILHPMATGSDRRAVVDPAALRSAQHTAFYTDDPGTQLKVLLMSVAFLSPPGNPPGDSFVTILRNKEVENRFTCYPAYCNNSYQTDTPHTRDLAGLLEASVPVEQITETYRLPDKIHAAHFRAMQDPDVVHVSAPDLPPLNKFVFPHRIQLYLPALLLETDDTGQTPLVPFDEDDYMARFTAAFEHAYPMTEAYRFRNLKIITTYPPANGWPVVSSEFDGYLTDADGSQIGIDRIMLIEPTLSVELAYRMSEALKGDDPFDLMPAFSAEPASLAIRLDALAESTLGRPCKGCFQIELPVATVDDIKAVPVDPISFTLSYTRIKTP